MFIVAFLISPIGIRIALAPLSLSSDIPEPVPETICILGGGYNPDRVLGISTEERIRYASLFIKAGYSTVHVIDYIGIHTAFYKQEVRRILSDMHAAKKISFHLSSNNTLDNCQVISSIIQKDEPCMVVTSPYHVLRTRMILHRMDYTGIRVVSPDDSEVYSHDSLKQWQRNFLLVYREYAAMVRDFVIMTRSD